MIPPRALYAFQRTTGNMRRHLPVSILVVLALTACWIPLGCFAVVCRMPHHLKPSWMEASGILVALRPTASLQDAQNIAESLKSWPEVRDVRTIPPGAAVRQLQEQLGQWGSLLDGLEEDVLPTFLEVTLKVGDPAAAGEKLEAFLEELKNSHPVDDILYGRRWQERLGPFLQGMEVLGLGGSGLLAVTVTAIMALVTRLIMLFHREELSVYRVVGASALFTRAPFYLEAASLGTLSGALASAVVLGALSLAPKFLPVPMAAAFSWNTLELVALTAILTAGAAALAGLGCWLAFQLFPETT